MTSPAEMWKLNIDVDDDDDDEEDLRNVNKTPPGGLPRTVTVYVRRRKAKWLPLVRGRVIGRGSAGDQMACKGRTVRDTSGNHKYCQRKTV